MKPILFEATYLVHQYADNILIDEFKETVNIRTYTSAEALSSAQDLLYASLLKRSPQVPAENYQVKLINLIEDPVMEGKLSYYKTSSYFYLMTGLDLRHLMLILRYTLVSLILFVVGYFKNNEIIRCTVIILNVTIFFCTYASQHGALNKLERTWYMNTALIIHLLQCLVFFF